MKESTYVFGHGTLSVIRDGVEVDTFKVLNMSVTISPTPHLSVTLPATPPSLSKVPPSALYAPTGPLMPPDASNTFPKLRDNWYSDQIRNAPEEDLHWLVDHFNTCGMAWGLEDIERFLSKCTWEYDVKKELWHIIYHGAKSRGKGNKAWYGSFWTKGKTVRAHKFFAVAILGQRPRPNREDELDHLCYNTRCVSCISCVPGEVNQKRIRRRSKNET